MSWEGTRSARRLASGGSLVADRITRVYFYHHTHTDIGYTHPQEEVAEQQAANIARAFDCCARTEHRPPESRFAWTVETGWTFARFWERADPAERERFAQYARHGRIAPVRLGCALTGPRRSMPRPATSASNPWPARHRPTWRADISWRPTFSPSARHLGGCSPDHESTGRPCLVPAGWSPTMTTEAHKRGAYEYRLELN
jgi:hypothetical protein